MKRGGPLKRGSPMARSSALTRTTMRRKRARVRPEETVGRQLVTARSMGLCEIDQRDLATDVHHRRNRSQGGTWAVENLMHICRKHHSQITTEPEWASDPNRGWAVRRRDNPATTAAFIHGRGLVLLAADGTYLPVEEAA